MFKRLALAAVLALSVAPAAEAANHGWYWGFEAGYDRVSNLSSDAPWSGSTLEADDSFAALVTVGQNLGPQLRLEGELAYRPIRFLYFDGWDSVSLIANVIYDIPIGGGVTASIGAGLGAAVTARSEATDLDYAYQLIGGLALAVAEHTELTLQYRYMGAGGPDDPGGNAIGYDSIDHHTLSLGLRFS